MELKRKEVSLKKAAASSVLVHFTFLLLILLAIAYVINNTVFDGLTGSAVYDPTTAKTQLETALSSAAFLSNVYTTTFCIAITTPESIESFTVDKQGTTYTVTQTTTEYCGEPYVSDFIIKFNTYDDFVSFTENPSFTYLLTGIDGSTYNLLPSKYVNAGGNVNCDAGFKSKFCSALTPTLSAEQLIDADLSCCIDILTDEQKELLAAHLQQGQYQDEMPVLESPEAQGMGFLGKFMTMTNMIVIFFVFILLTIGIFVVVSHGRHHAEKKMAQTPQASQQAPAGQIPSMMQQGTMQMPGQMPSMMQQGTMQQTAMPTAQMQTAQAAEDPSVTQIKQYLNEKLAQGYNPAQIQQHLVTMGWKEDFVNKVFMMIQHDREAAAQQAAQQATAGQYQQYGQYPQYRQ
jgi:hypothetical protein